MEIKRLKIGQNWKLDKIEKLDKSDKLDGQSRKNWRLTKMENFENWKEKEKSWKFDYILAR